MGSNIRWRAAKNVIRARRARRQLAGGETLQGERAEIFDRQIAEPFGKERRWYQRRSVLWSPDPASAGPTESQHL
jgi:hypothetical protein